MTIRQDVASQKNIAKMTKLTMMEKEKEEKEKLLRHKKILEHINKPIPKHEMSWKEVVEQNELKIKERKEKFKQELLMAVNNNALQGRATKDTIKEKIELLQKQQEEKDIAARKFIAKDPNKVAIQLENAKRAYELSQQQKAEKVQLLHENRKQIMQNIHNIPVLLSMEERAKKHAEKMEKKAKEIALKEAEKIRKEKEAENKKMNILINAKIPEASRRSTKSATYRTITVKAMKEKENAETERKTREQLRKIEQEKELSAILRAEILEVNYF